VDRQLLLTERAGPVALLTLNQPEKRNALSTQLLSDMLQEFRQLASCREVRVVILKATGTVFSSGHDLRELANCTEEAAAKLFGLCTEVMQALRQLPQPVLAQVQGLATAAGCQLAATCDLIVAAEEAAFATPGVQIGLFCTTPGVALARALPVKKALEMLLTGTPIGAREAERLGLVNRVVPGDRLAEETLALAHQIAQASTATVAVGKRAFYEQLPLPCAEAYQVAQPVMTTNAVHPDAQEGIGAFLGKRPPRWNA